ncbi:hypothetical protein GCM10023339_06960 [Alloalcanivorax gelatiniphagus]
MTRRSLVQLAKDAKHAQLVLRRRLPEAPAAIRDGAYRSWDRVRPYSYRDGAFPDSFIDATPKVHSADAAALPMRIFVMWTGDNPLTPNRAHALGEIRLLTRGTEVVLITPASLAEWVVDGAPVHPAYTWLSLNHRSDYLRAYLLHHHGGAYLDIKRGYGDVRSAMERLESTPGAWVSGYRELGADYVSDEAGSIHQALRRHHGGLLGNGAFAVRPRTPFTAEWLAEVDRRMDRWAPGLADAPGNTFGTNDGYPVPWAAVQGAVFQPLCLKYSERILTDERFRPLFENYR